MNWNEANIDTISGGAAKDKLNFAICEAVANCLDPNRDHKKARIVNLEIKLQPKEDRMNIDITAQAKTRLVPDKPCADHWAIDGNGVAHTASAHQMEIDNEIMNGAIASMKGNDE